MNPKMNGENFNVYVLGLLFWIATSDTIINEYKHRSMLVQIEYASQMPLFDK